MRLNKFIPIFTILYTFQMAFGAINPTTTVDNFPANYPLPTSQLNALMPLATVSVNQLGAPWSVTLAGSLNGAATSANQVLGLSLATSSDNNLAAIKALQTTANSYLSSIDLKLTNPLPVSMSSIPLATNAASASNQTLQLSRLNSIDATLANYLPSIESNTSTLYALTLAQLLSAFPFPVTGTFWQATQPISAVSLPLAPLAATSTIQMSTDNTLNSINLKTPPLGKALEALSVPSVLPQSQIDALKIVSSTIVGGTVGITSGTQVTLGSGSNTVGNIGNTSFIANIGTTNGLALEAGNLATLVTRTPALGPATAANSSPMVLASNQPAFVVSSDITKVGGAAISLGQKSMANSFPMTFASDQSALPTSITSGTIAIGSGSASIGRVISDAGTNTSTASLAIETGGNLASIKTNTDNLGLSLGSTTSGQKGNLNFGAVTASAPSYTTAQSNAFSLDLLGNLRVISTTSGTVTISAPTLPLPALAATSTKQSDGSQKTQIVDGSGNVIGSTANSLNTNVTSGTISLGSGTASVGQVTTNAGTNTSTASLNQEITQAAMSAKLPASLGAKTGAGSISMIPATDAIFSVASETVKTIGRVIDQGLVPSGTTTISPITGMDPANTTVASLGTGPINGVFTGSWIETTGFSNITVAISSDQSSATDGLLIQQSLTPSTAKLVASDRYTYTSGGDGAPVSPQVVGQYYRVVYTNGSTSQTQMALGSRLNVNLPKPSNVRIADNQSDQSDVMIVKSQLAFMNGPSTSNVSAVNPLPITGNLSIGASIVSATGTITTQNLLPTGPTPTPSSSVELSFNGSQQTGSINISGTYTGTLSIYYCFSDSCSVWFLLNSGDIRDANSGAYAFALAASSAGNYVIPSYSAKKVRVAASSAITGSAVVSLSAGAGFMPPNTQRTDTATIGGSTVTVGSGSSSTGTQRMILATDQTAIPVTPPTLTSGTQGSTGFSTQDLKDAGRNQTNYFMALPVLTAATETMQSMTGYKSGAAVGATVSPAVVTSGKRYRIQSITASYTSVGTIGSALIRLRANLSGAGVVGSPLVMSWMIGQNGNGTATAGYINTITLPIPDGLEFAAGTGIAIGILGEGATYIGAITGYVQVTINGYEY